jgi:hypothetical protein
MNSDREPISNGDASDTMLDELLSQARWPDVDPAAEARLAEHYRRVSIHGPSNIIRAAVAIAALIGVVLGIWFSMTRSKSPIAITPPVVPARPAPEVKKPEPLVRPLGPLERLALIEDRQQRAQRSKAPPQAVKPDPLASLRRLDNAALVRLAAATTDATRRNQAFRLLLERNDLQSFLYFVLRPNTRGEALALLHQMPNPPTGELLAELNHRQVDYRLAAAKALGGLCDRKLDRMLMTMVATNDHRREAIAALLSC